VFQDEIRVSNERDSVTFSREEPDPRRDVDRLLERIR